MQNNIDAIKVNTAFKTMEYELALCNVNSDRRKLMDNFLFCYLDTIIPNRIRKIISYAQTFPNDLMTDDEKRKVAILLWKALPSKAEFAQNFSIHILDKLDSAKASLNVPSYILEGLTHLK